MAARFAAITPSVHAPAAAAPLRRTRTQPRAAVRSATVTAGMAPPFGFLGLGIMGEAMARNLLKLGHGVVVWNRSADKARGRTEHA